MLAPASVFVAGIAGVRGPQCDWAAESSQKSFASLRSVRCPLRRHQLCYRYIHASNACDEAQPCSRVMKRVSQLNGATGLSGAPVGAMYHAYRRMGRVQARSSEAICASVRILPYGAIELGQASPGTVSVASETRTRG